MKLFRNIARLGFLFILLVTISLGIMACEPMLIVRVHNQADETLQIFLDDEVFIAEIIPGVEVTFKTDGIHSQYTVTAKDKDGNTVYVATWTKDDFINKGYKYDVYFPPRSD
ncbi:MAG: hypothetical protein HY529_00575 [Chloroflexi bacterium]|nr:hypothetical protein [Chloroflexota bacterium]